MINKDLRYGLRMLAKKPGFTIVAVVTLALGIGANTAIFSVVNGLLLRPLPYQDSERLAIIWTHSPGENVEQDWPSPGQYSAVKSETNCFEDLAIAQGGNGIIIGQTTPQRVGVIWTQSALFRLLGTKPLLGRVFTPDDDTPAGGKVAILSYGLWQRRYGGDPNIVGQSVTLDETYSIVGVMASDFSLGQEVMPTVGGVPEAELLLSLPMGEKEMASQGDENYNVLARLKRSVTIAQAQSELDAAVASLQRQFPNRYTDARRFSMSVKPLLEQVVGDIRPALLVLLGAVGCVLLIACANVANLLLARAATREKEIAIRTALGAGKWRIVRQLLTESTMLALVGGGLGLFIAVWGLEGLRWLNPGNIPRMRNVSIDPRVLLFTFLVSLITGVLFGLAPSLRSSRVNLSETLKEGGRGLVGTGNPRLRNLLVVAEIALSLVLLIGAGLLIRSFILVQRVNPGFDTTNVISMRISLLGTTYEKEPRRSSFYQQFWDRIRALPGVEAAGGVSAAPLSGEIGWGSITIEGYDVASGQSSIQADIRTAGVGYFETLRVPLISGRFFTEDDGPDSMKVAVIDEHMARSYWPDSDPVGKRFKMGGPNSSSPWRTVVGVVGNVKHYALDSDSRVVFYMPQKQSQSPYSFVTARTTGDPMKLASTITQEARALDPNVTVYDIKSMDQRLSQSLARRRFAMFALGLFAVVAMTLAAVGIYGVMSYMVAQRTREIGIRVALGANTRNVLALVVGQGMKLAAIGLLVGLTTAIAVTRVMGSLLFGVTATDPVTFVAIALILGGVALLACYIPARRAINVDPMTALRYE
jgi:predicted permease